MSTLPTQDLAFPSSGSSESSKALNLSFLVEVIDARSASWPAAHRFGTFDLYSVQIIFFQSLSTQVLFGYILFNLQLLGVFFSRILINF